jgi:hypothetical protein
LHQQPATPTAKTGKNYKYQKTPVPPAIENIRSGNNKNILNLQIPLKYKPIKQEHCRQEKSECEGVEKHSFLFMYLNIKKIDLDFYIIP